MARTIEIQTKMSDIGSINSLHNLLLTRGYIQLFGGSENVKIVNKNIDFSNK